MSAAAPRRFWAVTAAAVLGIAVTLALGAWQLSRAHAKLALQQTIEQREAQPALSGLSLLAPHPEGLLHRAVVVRGTWDAGHTVYLDNRQMRGLPGFYVVTPLMLENSDKAVLVQRGWAQRNFEKREQLPVVQTPPGLVEFTARIAPPPARLYEFKGTKGGAIRQNLDLPDFRAETGLSLLDVSLVQTGPASEGLLRDWPKAGSGSERNYGYAFQWWAMSALIVILYVWFQFIVPRRKVPHAR